MFTESFLLEVYIRLLVGLKILYTDVSVVDDLFFIGAMDVSSSQERPVLTSLTSIRQASGQVLQAEQALRGDQQLPFTSIHPGGRFLLIIHFHYMIIFCIVMLQLKF